jgi:hypothetical protein
MGLTLRPTGLGSPADKDRSDYTVFSGEFAVGRIHEVRGAPADFQGFWAITGIFGTPGANRPRPSSARTGARGWRGQS